MQPIDHKHRNYATKWSLVSWRTAIFIIQLAVSDRVRERWCVGSEGLALFLER